MAKFSRQAKGSVPPCRPLVVRWPVSALQNHANPSTGIDRREACLAFNAASIAMSTHLSTTHVTGVARYRRSRGPLFLPIARREMSLFVMSFTLSVICLFVLCVGRLIKLNGGWEGHLVRDQGLFIISYGW